MFTWIFRAVPVLLLTGCVGMGMGGNGSVTVTSDALVLAAPRGFCVDETQIRDNGVTASVIFGNCAGLSGSRLVRQPATPAVLTAAISESGAPDGIAASLATLREFFQSSDGRRVLSRTGDPETVTVLQSFVAGDVFYLRATDTSPGVVPGVQDTYWRAYFDIGPRIATLSVLSLDLDGAGEAEQLSVLEQFVAGTKEANQTATADAEDANGGRGLFNSGLFRRIVGTEARETSG